MSEILGKALISLLENKGKLHVVKNCHRLDCQCGFNPKTNEIKFYPVKMDIFRDYPKHEAVSIGMCLECGRIYYSLPFKEAAHERT